MQENAQRNIRGGAAWQYNSKFEGFEPFKNAKWTKPKALKLIRDFNFNPIPTSITIRGDLDRAFNKMIYRNASTDVSSSLPNYQKYFVFNRNYMAKWSLSKALSLDYNARVVAIIDEPDGDLDSDSLRQVVKDNLKNFGRMKTYEQSTTLNYTLPFDKIPILDWITVKAQYNGTYSWTAATLGQDTLGHEIQNSQNPDSAVRIGHGPSQGQKWGSGLAADGPLGKQTLCQLSYSRSGRPPF